MDDILQFSNKFREARLRLGLSQKKIAQLLGVSDKTISAYESGRAVPPVKMIIKISEVTNTNILEFLNQDGGYVPEKVIERIKDVEERISNIERLIVKSVK